MLKFNPDAVFDNLNNGLFFLAFLYNLSKLFCRGSLYYGLIALQKI